jgi:hypothetical protein
MAGHIVNFNGGWTHFSCPDIYRYRGVTFEFHRYCGPIRLKKNGDPSNVPMGRKFWAMFEAWQKLSPSKKKRTLIYS